MRRPYPLLRYLLAMSRRGTTLASCPHCRRLVFAVGRRARPTDPGNRTGLLFYLDIGREGIAALDPQRFAGDRRPCPTPEQFLADTPSPHYCCHWRALPVRTNDPLTVPEIPTGLLAEFETWIYTSQGRDGARHLLRALAEKRWGFSVLDTYLGATSAGKRSSPRISSARSWSTA